VVASGGSLANPTTGFVHKIPGLEILTTAHLVEKNNYIYNRSASNSVDILRERIMSRLSRLKIATIAALLTLASSPAHALSFSFSFTNAAANGGGTVTGAIHGLNDNASGQAASSVQVLSNTLGFGLGEYAGSPFAANIFDVSGGQITHALFSTFGSFNSAPAVTLSSLRFGFDIINNNNNLAGLTNSPTILNSQFYGDQTIFAPLGHVPVPLGSLSPVFTLALGAIGLFSWRRKLKKAAAIGAA
jgi:hypothetical protein